MYEEDESCGVVVVARIFVCVWFSIAFSGFVDGTVDGAFASGDEWDGALCDRCSVIDWCVACCGLAEALVEELFEF